MTKSIAIRIDEGLLKVVDDIGRAEARGRSEIVREALDSWIRRREVEEQVRRDREGYRKRPISPDEFGPVLGAQTWPK